VDTDIAIAVPAGTCTCHTPCSRVMQSSHIRGVANSGSGIVQMAELLLGADLVRAHSFVNADFLVSVLIYSPEASKHFIDTGAGVIDADYRGQVKVLLFNHSDTDFEGRPSYTTSNPVAR
jgi:dUTPase